MSATRPMVPKYGSAADARQTDADRPTATAVLSSAPMAEMPVSFPMKVLLGGAALVVVAVTYPWLWWEDRHVRRRVRAYARSRQENRSPAVFPQPGV